MSGNDSRDYTVASQHSASTTTTTTSSGPGPSTVPSGGGSAVSASVDTTAPASSSSGDDSGTAAAPSDVETFVASKLKFDFSKLEAIAQAEVNKRKAVEDAASGGGADAAVADKAWGRENNWRTDRYAFDPSVQFKYTLRAASAAVVGDLGMAPSDGSAAPDAGAPASAGSGSVPPCQCDVSIHENATAIGTRVWDAALMVSRFFEQRERFPESYWEGKRILEVGSGTGLVGVVLAHLGAELVTLTDLKQVLPNLQHNADTCCVHCRAAAAAATSGDSGDAGATASTSSSGAGVEGGHDGATAGGGAPEAAPMDAAADAEALAAAAASTGIKMCPVDVQELEWGTDVAAFKKRGYNFIVGTDLACPVSVIPNLVVTLKDMCAPGSGVEIYIAANKKRECTALFMELAEAAFTVERVPTEELDPAYMSEFTTILRMTR